MKEQVVVKAEPRAAKGTGPAGRLRRQGWLPGVVYSEGKPAQTIQINEHDFSRMLHHHRSEHMIMDLVVSGAPARKVLLKEIQHHPVDGHPLHADFYEVSMTRKVRVEIPIVLRGDPAGVQQGGILDHLLRAVEVECLPADLIEQIEVDVSGLAIGKHLTVADIKLDPARFTIQTGAGIAIAAVSLPRAEEEEAPAEAAAEGAAEPEVITAKKEEGEEGEEPAEGGRKAEKKEEKGAAKEAGKEKPAGKEKTAGKEKAGK
jgi:large subunit ribosomal protein L25